MSGKGNIVDSNGIMGIGSSVVMNEGGDGICGIKEESGEVVNAHIIKRHSDDTFPFIIDNGLGIKRDGPRKEIDPAQNRT